MTRSQLIQQANLLTERKGEKVFDLPTLYAQCLQEFCAENRFWWRKRTFSFPTVANTPQYDLGSVTTTPSIARLAVEEVTKVVYVQNSISQPELTPIFDDLTIAEMIYGAATPGPPGTYTFDLTDYKTLRINIPDAVYTVRIIAWMMPNEIADEAADDVLLVPPWLHRAIIHCMEKYIWRVIYGMQDPKYATAVEQYNKVLVQAQMRPRFTTNYSQQWISAEDSVQSTSSSSQLMGNG